jgi:transposase
MQVSTVGLDIAKNVFQVHRLDEHGRTVLRRKVRRDQLLKLFGGLEPCLVGMEACATAHHWARELGALGHEVRLMPPAYVKAYVKRNKQAQQERRGRCRGDLRGGDAADHALRADQVGRGTKRADAASRPPSARATAHGTSERDAGASRRVRFHCCEGHIAVA